jgi:hypothetical protein
MGQANCSSRSTLDQIQQMVLRVSMSYSSTVLISSMCQALQRRIACHGRVGFRSISTFVEIFDLFIGKRHSSPTCASMWHNTDQTSSLASCERYGRLNRRRVRRKSILSKNSADSKCSASAAKRVHSGRRTFLSRNSSNCVVYFCLTTSFSLGYGWRQTSIMITSPLSGRNWERCLDWDSISQIRPSSWTF